MRGALIWLGQGDPVATMSRLRATDPTITNLRAFLTAWRAQFRDEPMTSAAAIAKAEETITREVQGTGDENHLPDTIRARPIRCFTRPSSRSRAVAARSTSAPSGSTSGNRPTA